MWGVGDKVIETVVEGSPGPALPIQILARQTTKFDERGRLVDQTQWVFTNNSLLAQPWTTIFGYDQDDNRTLVSSSTGGVVRFHFDGLSRVRRMEDPFGNASVTSYDGSGNVSQIELQEIEGTAVRMRKYKYYRDNRSRLRMVEGPGIRREFDYDDRDVLVQQIGPLDVVTRFNVGVHGEVEESTIDPGGLDLHSQWTRDLEGRLVLFRDPIGEETTWKRDALGRVRRTRLGDASVWLHDYDVVGRVVRQTMPSGTVALFEYSMPMAPVRAAILSKPGLDPIPDHKFAYDALERLVRAEKSGEAIELKYDSLGRLAEETALGSTVSIEHDALGRSSDLFFPDGRCERTEYDALGRPTCVKLMVCGALGGVVGTELLRIEYSGFSLPMSTLSGNGVKTSFAYDDARRLIRIDVRGVAGKLIDSVRIRHDERGRRAVVQNVGSPMKIAFSEFDDRNRLQAARSGFSIPPLSDVPDVKLQAASIASVATAASASGTTHSYQLDAADDRLRKVITSTATNVDIYTYHAGHRISAVDTHTVTHHPDGHRASDDRFCYDTDALGRITRIRDAATAVVRAEFHYDALGRVASGMTDDEMFSRSFRDRSWIHEKRGAKGEVRQLTTHPLSSVPICVTELARSSFLHEDGGSSILCSTDAGGLPNQRYRFGPFGEPQVFSGDGITKLAKASAFEPVWRGMQLVGRVDLYATPSRLYDPLFGGFLARDPKLYRDSPSPYVYAAQNPVDFIDPTGRDKTPVEPTSVPWHNPTSIDVSSREAGITGVYGFAGVVGEHKGLGVGQEALGLGGYDIQRGMYGGVLSGKIGVSGELGFPAHHSLGMVDNVEVISGEETLYYTDSKRWEKEHLTMVEMNGPGKRFPLGIGGFVNRDDPRDVGFYAFVTVDHMFTVGGGVTVHLEKDLEQEQRETLEKVGIKLVRAQPGTPQPPSPWSLRPKLEKWLELLGIDEQWADEQIKRQNDDFARSGSSLRLTR